MGGKRRPPATIDPITERYLCCLCKQRPIQPRDEEYPNSGQCATCRDKKRRQRRHKQWDAGLRPICKNHPFSIVNKAMWIRGSHLCASCCQKRTIASHNANKKRNRTYGAKQRLNPQWLEAEKLRKAIYYQRMKDSLGGIHF